MTIFHERISCLREQLKLQVLDGYLIPSQDEFLGEYVPPAYKRLEWLTGFTGSNGLALILQNQAVFFTDGRYALQAVQQLPKDIFHIVNVAEMSLGQWLKEKGTSVQTIGYDSRLFTAPQIEKYQQALSQQPTNFIPIEKNIIDLLWQNRPSQPSGEIQLHPLEYTGQSWQKKRDLILYKLREQGADAVFIAAPDSICWLLNLRAEDVPFTPLLLCSALITAKGKIIVFTTPREIPLHIKAFFGKEVEFQVIPSFAQTVETFNLKTIFYDPAQTSMWYFELLKSKGCHIVERPDPCSLPKAQKNEIELAGIRQAHLKDGAALVECLHWIEEQLLRETSFSEIDIENKLLEFRNKQENFCYPSFASIVGFNANGAIIHYHATPETNVTIASNGLLLIDSGGQYLEGTTDVTRTLAIGKVTPQQKIDFTAVLKGHITLARAVFPLGTTGSQLDALARYPLWQIGKDYDHGTGHGVGCFLSVHEGPQRISKANNNVALQPGMVISNEPGFYADNHYGIRIENLVAVIQMPLSSTKPFLGFETLTQVPIDRKLIEVSYLNSDEREWLDQYHHTVFERLESFLIKNKPALDWLYHNTRPL